MIQLELLHVVPVKVRLRDLRVVLQCAASRHTVAAIHLEQAVLGHLVAPHGTDPADGHETSSRHRESGAATKLHRVVTETFQLAVCLAVHAEEL